MIDRDPSNLLREIKFAQKVRDRYLSTMREIVGRIHGPAYLGRNPADQTYLEPHGYEYSTLMLGKMSIETPRWRTVVGGGELADMGALVRANMNQWSRQGKTRRTLTRLSQDSLVNCGVCLTYMAPRRGYEQRARKGEEVPMAPRWQRVPQHRFFMDPLCTDFYDDCRYKGHTSIETKEALLQKANDSGAGWRRDVIEAIKPDSAVDEARGWKSGEVQRDDIAYHEIWVPEIELEGEPGPEAFFHGTLFTVAESPGSGGREGEGIFIRDPRPYFGPRWGGYTLYGIYPVVNEPWPLGPLTAVNMQVRELNDQLRAANQSAREYKRLVLVDSSQKKLAETMTSSPHDYVVIVEGLEAEKVVVIEVGGCSEQQIKQILLSRGILDRVSAMGDAQRGTAGEGTATANAIADQSQNVRVGFIKGQFGDCVSEAGRTAAEFMWNDPRYESALDAQSLADLKIQTMPGKTPKFRGGVDTPIDLEDLGLSLEPLSMGLTTEQAEMARVMSAIQFVLESAALVPQMPWVDFKRVYGAAGDVANLPALDEIVDVDMAMQFAGQMQGFAPQMQTMREARGRVGGTFGTAGPRGPAGGGSRGGFMGSKPTGAGQLGGPAARMGLGSLGGFQGAKGGNGAKQLTAAR